MLSIIYGVVNASAAGDATPVRGVFVDWRATVRDSTLCHLSRATLAKGAEIMCAGTDATGGVPTSVLSSRFSKLLTALWVYLQTNHHGETSDVGIGFPPCTYEMPIIAVANVWRDQGGVWRTLLRTE